ncbi:MAG TPA: UTP--glucose-1-phosphate uridylyltransferase GalU [Haliangiales bacterium]|nr:UTP--glucose-1-phosphate uridylyltransferase GalU [Haliangiales bacterium]
MRVRKAVIPAAGLGTRFLPATKAVPKEMLPIVDTPTIQIVVEEAVAAGIEEIILVNGRQKGAIEDHFDVAYELEDTLARRGKTDLLAQVARISGLARVVSLRQKHPNGLGHAVLCARDAVGDEPFAVMLGDDLYDAERPAIGQLIDVAARAGMGAVAVMEVPAGQEHLYGVVAGEPMGEGLYRARDMVEKPAPGTAPSRLAIVGRYVLPASIWPILAQTKPGKGGEIQLTDALRELARAEGLCAAVLAGERHDAGDRLGYLRANLAYALKRPELRDGVLALCREMLSAPRGTE